MSQNLRTFTKSLYTLDAVAQRVPSNAWDNPSCCTGWSARHVAGHAAWLIKNLGSIAAGEGSIEGQREELVLGDVPAVGMRTIVETTLRQLDQQHALSPILPTPWGDLSVDDFIGEVWIDPIVHAWDLADATGTAHGIDEATAQAALTQLQAMSESHIAPWELGSAQPPAAETAVARLIAFTGRTATQPALPH